MNEPNWRPLEIAPGKSGARPHDFMAMGMVGALHAYKHTSTRRYLYLDEAGNAYDPRFREPMALHAAIRWAYS